MEPSTSWTPSASPSQPVLRPARLADLPAIARCWYDGFFDDEVIGDIIHPNRKQFPEDVYWFLLRGVRERFWDWRHQFIVLTVEEGGKERIVGAADWRRLGAGGRTRELWGLDPRNLVAPTLHVFHQASLFVHPNRAQDPSRASFLASAVDNSKKYWTGEKAECWDLHVCGVHPNHQGKGIGLMLVKWGVSQAEKEKVFASVICGEKNRGFYGKGGLTECVGKPGNGEGGGIVLFTKAIK